MIMSFTWKYVATLGACHIRLAEGVAKILSCGKLVLVLFTINL